MKKIIVLISAILVSISLFAFVSCGAQIEGVSFSDESVEYDGTEKAIEVAGVPEGATVTYSPANSFKDAGVYTVTATVKQAGFSDTVLTANLTITPKVVTVTYDKNIEFKGSGEAPTSVPYTVNGVIEGDTVELAFDFGDCEFEEGDKGTFTASSKNPNYTLKASSQKKDFTVGENAHTVKFETGVSGQTINDEKIEDGTKMRDPRPIINTGYELIGWYNGEELWDFKTGIVTSDMTLVAKWRANMYSVNYYLDGGKNSSENPTTFAFDEGYVLKAPTKEGYVFDGWYEDADFKKAVTEKPASTRSANAFYYAKWSYKPVSELKRDVWVIGDNVNTDSPYSWTRGLRSYAFVDFAAITPENSSSAAAIEYLTEALKTNSPKYVIWSFAFESGETYDSNVNSFLALCALNDVTPILTTQPESFGTENGAKNSAVTLSGAKYIDFASVINGAKYASATDYTSDGVITAVAKVVVDVPELITPESPIKHESAQLLNAGSNVITLGNCRIKDSKYYIFTANLSEIGEDEKLIFEHGYMTSYGRWIEVTSTKLELYSYTSWSETPLKCILSEDHGLDIKDYITIIIKADSANGGKQIIISTNGGVYTRGFNYFSSCDGSIAVHAEGVELTNAELSFACKDYSQDIWIIGASYLSLDDPARWPYYMYQEGYFNALLIGRGGMGNQHAVEDLKDALKHGTPTYLVWDSASGNNPDATLKNPENTINPVFLEYMIEVMELCKEYNIKLIIEVLPNALEQTNWYKNKAIMNHEGVFANYDYEIIDVAKSLGAHDEYSPWYDGMLYSDKVHPTKLGAVAYYLQMLVDFPELMSETCAKVYRAIRNTLAPKEALTIEQMPEKIEHNKVITFTADMDGNFTGVLEIGNGKGVEGGTYVRIERDKICVYTTKNGTETKTELSYNQYVKGKAVAAVGEDASHPIKISDYINVKIHIEGYKAKICIMSSGLDMGTTDAGAAYVELFTIETDWVFEGDVYATVNGQTLTDAKLSFFTE